MASLISEDVPRCIRTSVQERVELCLEDPLEMARRVSLRFNQLIKERKQEEEDTNNYNGLRAMRQKMKDLFPTGLYRMSICLPPDLYKEYCQCMLNLGYDKHGGGGLRLSGTIQDAEEQIFRICLIYLDKQCGLLLTKEQAQYIGNFFGVPMDTAPFTYPSGVGYKEHLRKSLNLDN